MSELPGGSNSLDGSSNKTSRDIGYGASDDNKLTQNLIICISIAMGLLLILFLVIQLTRRFGIDRSKGENAPRRWQRNSTESYGTSPCEFKAGTGSLVAVRNKAELAFPDLSATSIQTTEPLPSRQPSCYFEVEILSCPEQSNICFGLAPEGLSSLLTPGHADNSIGYGSLDGQLYCSGLLLRFLPELRYSTRDIVGCGFFPRAQMVLFTKNGERVAYIPFLVSTERNINLYPTVASIGTSTVRVNFGQRRFTYREANQNAWGFGVYSEMEIYDLPSPPPAYGTSDPESNPQSNTVPTANLTRRSSFTPHP